MKLKLNKHFTNGIGPSVSGILWADLTLTVFFTREINCNELDEQNPFNRHNWVESLFNHWTDLNINDNWLDKKNYNLFYFTINLIAFITFLLHTFYIIKNALLLLFIEPLFINNSNGQS